MSPNTARRSRPGTLNDQLSSMGRSTDGGRPANAACNGHIITDFRGTALTGYRDAYDWGLAKGRMSPLYLTCCQGKPYLYCQAAVPKMACTALA